MENVDLVIEKIVLWLKDRVKSANAKGLVFGLSGGIDSAVVAALAKKAFPDTSLGIAMPIHSRSEDMEHAELVAKYLDLELAVVDLSKTYDSLIEASKLNSCNKLAKANIKPRLRMTTLYYFAQNNGYLVCGSSNKSEFEIGYFTKYGDSGSDLMPLVSFVKSEIREIARALDIPEIIINKPPTAGLWTNQTDEDEMGFSYDMLDHYIKTGQGPEKIVNRIKYMQKNSSHKREFAHIFKL